MAKKRKAKKKAKKRRQESREVEKARGPGAQKEVPAEAP